MLSWVCWISEHGNQIPNRCSLVLWLPRAWDGKRRDSFCWFTIVSMCHGTDHITNTDSANALGRTGKNTNYKIFVETFYWYNFYNQDWKIVKWQLHIYLVSWFLKYFFCFNDVLNLLWSISKIQRNLLNIEKDSKVFLQLYYLHC